MKMKKRLEQGQGVVVFALGLIVLAWLVVGLMDDLGRLALAEVRAYDAVQLAAQDAANFIDPNAFFSGQQVRLSARAVWHAQDRASALTWGRVSLNRVVISGDGRTMIAGADLEVPMRWLWRVGVPVARRSFAVRAVPSYGLQVEWD
ncbi:MAG: hypothetical protein Kow00120_15280 [Anaerolineae bacterium]